MLRAALGDSDSVIVCRGVTVKYVLGSVRFSAPSSHTLRSFYDASERSYERFVGTSETQYTGMRVTVIGGWNLTRSAVLKLIDSESYSAREAFMASKSSLIPAFKSESGIDEMPTT